MRNQGWIQEFEMGGGGGAKSYTLSQKGVFRGVFIENFGRKGGGGGVHPLHHPGSSPGNTSAPPPTFNVQWLYRAGIYCQ